MEYLLILVCLLVGLYLLSRRWVWVLAFGIGGLASAFSTLASIFHFQILGALGFFFLMVICWFITAIIAQADW